MQNFNAVFAVGVILIMTLVAPTTLTAQDTRAELTIVNPDGLYNPAPNGYSHAIVAANVSRIAFIAGQTGETPDGRLSPAFENQVQQSYTNLQTALDAVGALPDQVVKLTTYVVDYDQSMLAAMTGQLRALFGDHLPAQTLVPVPRLALDGVLFEVDAIAILGDAAASED
jgi:enamine deaminase RidA (YjgF/YER057c/UK114 family)